ncbi:hypothetical protein BJV78DRAFT_1284288 [Lactifluus subvellereus]|nr:hypothetical protein BJV78DRAFT_1284288 [Lactifluus subvellereus]
MAENSHVEREVETAPSPAMASSGAGSPQAADDASRSVTERRSGAKYKCIRRRKKREIGPAKASNAIRSIAMVDATKSSWRGWLSWGKSQTRETADDLKTAARMRRWRAWDARFKEARHKVAEKDEDIKRRAGETKGRLSPLEPDCESHSEALRANNTLAVHEQST